MNDIEMVAREMFPQEYAAITDDNPMDPAKVQAVKDEMTRRSGRMVVAYYMPHNDGTETGILDAPGQSTGLSLVDLYEVDGEIRSFGTRSEAEEWLAGKK